LQWQDCDGSNRGTPVSKPFARTRNIKSKDNRDEKSAAQETREDTHEESAQDGGPMRLPLRLF